MVREAREAAPTPAAIREARVSAGLTQSQAAEMTRVALRTWQQWESGDRTMSLTAWDLFRIRAGVAAG